MVSDETYELCLPILQDPNIEDEDKTDKLEELLKKETTLTGPSLENAILDVLWRHPSWRGSATPVSGSPRLGVSPLAPPGFIPTSLSRTKSSTVSPFSSPRPSPRLAFAAPAIPHSPNLNAYEFASDTSPAPEIFGDFQTENVDWLVSDDALSVTSSVGNVSGLNAAAPEYVSAQQSDMTPYDMLRSILGQSKTDEEIETALALHGYDLSATITAMMESQGSESTDATTLSPESKSLLIGKSTTPDIRPSTPSTQQKAGIICKFYLSTGQCLRADCRFSHDLSNHICKYWIMGNCLAGDTCIFSHDPAHLINRLNVDGNSTPPQKSQNLQVQDHNAFPALRPATPELNPYAPSFNYTGATLTPPPGLKPIHAFANEGGRSRSRPGSRPQTKDGTTAPSMDDNDAFPSLSSASAKPSKKHHGKRGGHGHGHKENYTPSSLADIVKMSPSPSPGPNRLDSKKIGRNGSTTNMKNGENSPAALAIPTPKQIPWLETGDKANKAYLKSRQEAIKHGGLRNKFLQSAAQAWNRNDARAAKALSLRGQSENDLMRKAHREAARELYEARNKGNVLGSEIYVDLHGLHPEEAVEYLESVLLDNSTESKPVYAITGTGHHSKNGKDKVGKAVRNFLNEWRYAYREFSVPGDRSSMGGILGIDARSWDKSLVREEQKELADTKEEVDILSQGVEIGDGKVRLLVRDPPKGPSGNRSK
ncbi:hypothetical protein GQX73_g5459 [Xylaria multiplex]|uniref:Uncharacterized protein n=1 Tax=Xylaria multiplex TaxID=323545 RepID=A0A7C8IUD7_9PEZI|nr:hypothetical protein GQX73_g5459 [Xylaria multiplex]